LLIISIINKSCWELRRYTLMCNFRNGIYYRISPGYVNPRSSFNQRWYIRPYV